MLLKKQYINDLHRQLIYLEYISAFCQYEGTDQEYTAVFFPNLQNVGDSCV